MFMGSKNKGQKFAVSAIFFSGLTTCVSAVQEDEDIFSLEPVHKMNPCYWLSREIPDEGLCGAKMRPDVKVLVQEAERGNSIAAMRLGQLFGSGNWGIEQDTKKAIKWYTRAAEMGDRQSQIRLGQAYEYARMGAKKNLRLAVKFYTMATENGIYPDLEEKINKLEKKLSSKK